MGRSFSCHSLNLRTQFRLVRQTGRSLSILVVSRKDLYRRYLNEKSERRLLERFSSIEPEIWNTFGGPNSPNRPEELFLVTGHILASDFTVYHAQDSDDDCTITMKARAEGLGWDRISNMSDVQLVFDPCARTSSTHFVQQRQFGRNEVPRLFSICLEVKPSKPIRKIEPGRAGLTKKKIKHTFEYYAHSRT